MIKRSERVKEAQKAFTNKDLIWQKQAHDKERISSEAWHKTEQGKYLAPAVFGASDGIVTTFAIVAGVVGADLSPGIVLILGFANLFADGFSMAVGDYISQKSEREYIKSEREREAWEVEVNPEGERTELEEIYRKKGLEGEQLDTLLDIITSDKELWISTMMHEELGILDAEEESPLKSAIVTFVSFAIAGFMPLLAYVLASVIPQFRSHMFSLASIITAITLFVIGATRQAITGVKWYKGGLEMLITGGLSASVAYLIGYLLNSLAGVM